jgi:hypothetical protein
MPIAGSTLGFVMRFDKLLRSLVETDLEKIGIYAALTQDKNTSTPTYKL